MKFGMLGLFLLVFVVLLPVAHAIPADPQANSKIEQTPQATPNPPPQQPAPAESPSSGLASAVPDSPAAPQASKPQDETLVFRAEPPTDPSVFEVSVAAKNFQFGKVDLELLKQVDALDKYLEDHGMIFTDPVVTGYVERIGRSVVPPSAPANVKWRFRVIRDPEPNAFALPNGSIYVHSGLLSRLQNEAQLAGVLAHESTHVFNRHAYTSYHDMRKKVVAIEVLQIGASAAGLGGVNCAVVNAIGNFIPMIVVETVFGYRRELERESDAYAVRVMQGAGYDPEEMAKALDLLKHGPEVDLSEQDAFWADHPKLEDRVRDTQGLAKQIGEPANGGRKLEIDYSASTKNAVRHDANLAIMLGRPRTAVAIAERLIELEPNNPDNYALLGDAYRALGARSVKPLDEELNERGKKQARKMLRKMTQAEYDKALLAAPGGKEQFDINSKLALESFTKALALDPNNAMAARGIGFLDEAEGLFTDAAVNFKKYLELTPNAKDARQVRQRIQNLEKSTVNSSTSGAGK